MRTHHESTPPPPQGGYSCSAYARWLVCKQVRATGVPYGSMGKRARSDEKQTSQRQVSAFGQECVKREMEGSLTVAR